MIGIGKSGPKRIYRMRFVELFTQGVTSGYIRRGCQFGATDFTVRVLYSCDGRVPLFRQFKQHTKCCSLAKLACDLYICIVAA